MSDYTGNFEGIKGGVVRGWCFYHPEPGRRCFVQIVIDDQIVAQVLCCDMRVDVANLHDDALYSGFEFTIPRRLLDGRVHVAKVMSADDGQLGRSECFEIRSDSIPNSSQFQIDRSNSKVIESLCDEKIESEQLCVWFDLQPTVRIVRAQPEASLFQKDNLIGGLPSHRKFQELTKYLVIGRNVIINPDHGVVYGGDGSVWSNTTYLRDSDLIRDDRRRLAGTRDGLRKLSGQFIVFSTSAKSNYFHWHLDCLSGLFYAQSLLSDAWIPICGNLNSWQAESLQLMGVNVRHVDDLCELEKFAGTCYLDGRGIFPDSNIRALFLHLKTQLSGRLSFKSKVGPKRIFISRKDSLHRVLGNEEELSLRLEGLGFERLVLSQLTYLEQVTAFSQAKLIIAMHGAGLTNIGFCDAGASVVEIVPRNYTNFCFRFLAVQCSISHHWYPCDTGNGIIDIADFISYLAESKLLD